MTRIDTDRNRRRHSERSEESRLAERPSTEPGFFAALRMTGGRAPWVPLVHLCSSVLSLLFVVTVPAIAKGDRVDDYIRQEMARRHIPGLQLAVLKDGKPVKMGYYGLANVEHGVPVKPETIFQI